MYNIIAIDDDEHLLASLRKLLARKKYDVTTLTNPINLIKVLMSDTFHAVLLDVKIPGHNGLEILRKISAYDPSLPVIMISGESTISVAVDALKKGAYDFLEKPVDPEKLFVCLNNALKKKELVDQNEALISELADKHEIIAESKQMKQLLNQAYNVAQTDAKVLIYGESGTGKELIAKSIHYHSKRKGKPFISLNCAAIPSELLESELFGHRKGTFTGADKDRVGKFQAAEGGTLFLDEIGDMSLSLQSKLLRALEASEIEIIGENSPVKIDVRIISATNKNLLELIDDNKFRMDLYHRLNVIKLVIPPLRDRTDDIIPIANHFIKRYSHEYNKRVSKLSRQVEGVLLNQKFPGNVRELRNIIEKLVIFSNGDEISIDEVLNSLENLSGSKISDGVSTDLKLAMENYEKDLIYHTLSKNNWRINETSNALGIDRTNLFRKMKKYDIENR
ncbi:MAG: sigma-54 dependent transcriptional regulator [Candidatus Cloacimonetes bacterium]|nr:sigma-54 dependent transcriptional regulator [Candidatus Cloacimonadota bacterium]